MIEWVDSSDKHSRFFVANVDCQVDEAGIYSIFGSMLDCMQANIIGKGNAINCDKFFVEINCDTGRIIISLATDCARESGRLDGCAVRAQSLQDFWYDLDESGLPDDDFSHSVRAKVSELGMALSQVLSTRKLELLNDNKQVDLVVYGSEPGAIVFSMKI